MLLFNSSFQAAFIIWFIPYLSILYVFPRDLSQSCLRCWSFVLLIDDWRKALLYLLLSVFCLIRNFLLEGEAWLSVIAGILQTCLFFLFTLEFSSSRQTGTIIS